MLEHWTDPDLIKKIKRRKKKPTIGDYVIVSRYSDLDPNDPWYISFLDEIRINARGTHYIIQDSSRYWKHARIIKKAEGDVLLKGI